MLGWNPLTKDFKNLSFILSYIICYNTNSVPIYFISMGAAPSKTTKEILTENKNAIRSSIREITREQRQVERRRSEVEAKIKKSAKEGRVVSLLKVCEK